MISPRFFFIKIIMGKNYSTHSDYSFNKLLIKLDRISTFAALPLNKEDIHTVMVQYINELKLAMQQ